MVDQIRDSRTVEFRVRQIENRKNASIWLKFSQKLRLEKLTRTLFYSEYLTSVVLELQTVFCDGKSGELAKTKFSLSRSPNFLKNSLVAPYYLDAIIF